MLNYKIVSCVIVVKLWRISIIHGTSLFLYIIYEQNFPKCLLCLKISFYGEFLNSVQILFFHHGSLPTFLSCLCIRVKFPTGAQIFLFRTIYRPALESTQTHIQWVMGSSHGGKALDCEADYSPPSTAKVRSAWNFTSISPYIIMAWILSRGTVSSYLNLWQKLEKKYDLSLAVGFLLSLIILTLLACKLFGNYRHMNAWMNELKGLIEWMDDWMNQWI